MKTNFDTSHNTANFGAVYTQNFSKIERKVGKEMLNELKKAIPELEKFKADIHIKARPNRHFEDFSGFNIKVTNITKSPLRRLLGLYNGKSVLKGGVAVADECIYSSSISSLIVEKAAKMISKL